MHPNPLFRSDDRAFLEALIDRVGFGTVFLTTPDGPRVAHTPLLSTGEGAIRFHLSRGNALTRHLDGARALIVVNGPHGYVSPRWYDNRDTVPTWDYVALELEGQVRRMGEEGTEGLLHTLIERGEARIEGEPWLASEKSAEGWDALVGMIVGFELEAAEWRPTVKLSQKSAPHERLRIAAAQQALGNPALAAMMREVAA